MESSEITAFIQNANNFWIVLGLGIFLIIDGLGLRYLIKKNYLNTAKTAHKKTNYAQKLLLTSATLTAIMGVIIIATAFYFR